MPATAQRSAPILTAGGRHPFHAGFPEHIKPQLFYMVKKKKQQQKAGGDEGTSHPGGSCPAAGLGPGPAQPPQHPWDKKAQPGHKAA